MQPQAERRQLTVMFCDLVGSTALSAQLDPEDLRAVIGLYHRCCAEVIGRAGGFVAKYMGDGVLAYFGYPVAHEDDAERAVRAGLDLIQEIRALTAGQALQTRIGIATGLVVVGEVIGQGAAQEQAVVGETPNLAARLQPVAEPGSVVIAPSTRRLLAGLFEYRDLGAVALKGFAEPVAAFQVLRPSTVESRFEARQERGISPLVGRAEELELLLRRWRQACAGEGRVVLLIGEAGIGKSRMVRELLDRLADEPHVRQRYSCSPHHQDSALHPIIAQIEHAAGFGREDSAKSRLEKLQSLLGTSNATDEEIAFIAGLLSVPVGDRYQLPDMSPQRRKEKTLQALLAQSERLAATRPLLVVFEDMHWIDPTSLELLILAIERWHHHPILLLLTARPEFTPPWPNHAHANVIALGRLARAEGLRLVEGTAGRKPLPAEVLDQVLTRTDGIPLFVEELTKTVLESGLLHEEDGRYVLSAPLPSLAIPTTLHDSLMARLDRLAPVREVAQIGAAIGREFSYELLCAVAGIPEDRLVGALSELVRSELVFCRGVPPDATYTFKHALVQDAAYQSMLKSRRIQLHVRITELIEREFPDLVSLQPELVAYHSELAGLTENAVGYLLAAGRRGLAQAAMKEALSHLQKGLTLVARLPKGTAQRELELGLQIALGQALIATQGYSTSQVGKAFARARELCDQLDEPPQFVPVLFGQLVNHVVRGELAHARRDAEELLQFGEAYESAALVVGSLGMGAACYWSGEFGAARANLVRSIILYDPTHSVRYAAITADDPCCMAAVYLAATLLSLGYPDQAQTQRDRAIAGARPHAHTLGFVLAHSCLGDWGPSAIMLPRAEEAVTLASERGFPVWWGSGLMFQGWCVAALGQPAEGITLFQQGLTVWRAIGAMMDLPMFLMLLADAYGKLGEPRKGLDQLDEADRTLESNGARQVEAEIHRVRGELLVLLRQSDAAEQQFQRALAVAKEQGAKLWELRAATSLARLWRAQDKETETRKLLSPIYDWFTEGFDYPDLKEAKGLLDEISATAR